MCTESQRMNAVILSMNRTCTVEYTLPSIGNQKKPVKIPPGTHVTIPARAIHLYVSIID